MAEASQVHVEYTCSVPCILRSESLYSSMAKSLCSIVPGVVLQPNVTRNSRYTRSFVAEHYAQRFRVLPCRFSTRTLRVCQITAEAAALSQLSEDHTATETSAVRLRCHLGEDVEGKPHNCACHACSHTMRGAQQTHAF